MSAETIVKKRGRPKKIVSEPIEQELRAPEVKTATTRAKSTTAAPKATKAKVSAPAKVPAVKKSTLKAAETPKVVSKTVEAPVPSPKPSPVSKKVEPQPLPTKTPVTPETSKILQQVRDLSAKTVAQNPTTSKLSTPPNDSPKISKPTQAVQPKSIPAQAPKAIPTTSAAKPAQQAKTATSPTMSKPSPPTSKSAPPPPSNTTPKPTPRIPIAALNSAVVSNISERAGARPNSARSKALPQTYNQVARKITFAIVAAPIAIVTSYVLYQRLVLGEDRKLLVPAKVDSGTPESPTVTIITSSDN